MRRFLSPAAVLILAAGDITDKFQARAKLVYDSLNRGPAATEVDLR